MLWLKPEYADQSVIPLVKFGLGMRLIRVWVKAAMLESPNLVIAAEAAADETLTVRAAVAVLGIASGVALVEDATILVAVRNEVTSPEATGTGAMLCVVERDEDT
jgi:hypothetical protein